MKTFKVLLEEHVTYTVILEAEDASAAEEAAAELWADSEDPTADYEGTGLGVEVLITEEYMM